MNEEYDDFEDEEYDDFEDEEYDDFEDEEYDEEFSSVFMNSYEELMESRKVTLNDLREHITGPVLSTIIHVVLLAFLGAIIVIKAPEKSEKIAVALKNIKPQEIERPPIPPPEPTDPIDTQDPIATSIEREDIEVNIDIHIDNISVSDTDNIELPNLLNMKMSNSALSLSIPAGVGSKKCVVGKFLGTGGGKASRFAFVLDYSASMGGHHSGNKKIDVMKEHLIKAIRRFRGNGQICIIPFAGGGWLLDGEWPLANSTCNKKSGTARRCRKLDPATLTPRWVVPTRSNLEILKKLIYETDTLYGTNWASGMDIALNYLNPKPDVIFFMTDGQVSEKCAEETLRMVQEAKLKNKRLVIHSIAFGLTEDAGSKGKKSKKKKAGKRSPRCDPNFYLPEIAKVTGGQYKSLSKADIKEMSDVKKITEYDAVGKLDYSPPKPGKAIPKEKEVVGLLIE